MSHSHSHTAANSTTFGVDDPFGITLMDLRELMERRGGDAITTLEPMGGVAEICKKLKVSPNSGLTGDHADLARRQQVYGKNVIPPKKAKSFCRLILEALEDTTLIILMISAAVSAVLWVITKYGASLFGMAHEDDEDEFGWIDSLAILVSVAAVCLVTAFNDWSKEKQFRGLQSKLEGDHNFSVLRKGEVIQVNNADIVVGDICQV